MARIAVGGFQHETNTFSPQPASLQDFLSGGGWPGLLRGPAVLDITRPMNLPIAGAVRALAGLGHEPVPLVWAAATPSGRVEQPAFEYIADLFLATLREAGPVDGVYLDLHGAMATAAFDDGEGEFLRRVREAVGPGVPIVASLDLHANVSQAMFDLADGLVGYRTYPHIDMDETGARAARLLDTFLRRATVGAKAMLRLDFMVALTSQCTLAGPAAALYAELARIEREQDLDALSWTGGFALADVADCGQSVLAYGARAAAVEAAADELAGLIARAEPGFDEKIWSEAEAVQYAMAASASARGPIVLADTQDNPGGGGSSDTTGLLRGLLDAGADNAVVAMIRDPQAAAAAHAAGAGAVLELALGGKTPDRDGHPGLPCERSYRVCKLTDGCFTGTGPMWGGSPIDLGPTVLLQVDGVRVIVVSAKMQAADQSILRHVGIDPAGVGMLVLKSSVHFRADFQALAAEILVVESPGLVCARPAGLPYARLRPGLRLPGGVAFHGKDCAEAEQGLS